MEEWRLEMEYIYAQFADELFLPSTLHSMYQMAELIGEMGYMACLLQRLFFSAKDYLLLFIMFDLHSVEMSGAIGQIVMYVCT